MSFQIIRPVNVTDAILDATNVAEDDAAEYNPATTYGEGDRVITAATHELHQSVIAGNTGNDPTDYDITKWVVVSKTRPYRMFDRVITSQTTNTDSVEVEITAGSVVTGVALLNCIGNTAQVIVTDPTDGEVYNQTKTFSNDLGVTDWYEYFFSEIEPRTALTFLDLPPYSSATIDIIVENEGGTVAIGECALGFLSTVGVALWDVGVGIIDYSRKETNAFGDVLVTERAFSKRANFDVLIDTPRVSAIQRMLAEIRAQPVVYIGSEEYEALVIYGFFRDFEIVLPDINKSICSIEIEGLT